MEYSDLPDNLGYYLEEFSSRCKILLLEGELESQVAEEITEGAVEEEENALFHFLKVPNEMHLKALGLCDWGEDLLRSSIQKLRFSQEDLETTEDIEEFKSLKRTTLEDDTVPDVEISFLTFQDILTVLQDNFKTLTAYYWTEVEDKPSLFYSDKDLDGTYLLSGYVRSMYMDSYSPSAWEVIFKAEEPETEIEYLGKGALLRYLMIRE